MAEGVGHPELLNTTPGMTDGGPSARNGPAIRRRWGFSHGRCTERSSFASWLLLALIFSILLEGAGMFFYWRDAHSRTMLTRELSYLNEDLRQSLFVSRPALFGAKSGKALYHYHHHAGVWGTACGTSARHPRLRILWDRRYYG